MSWEANKNHKDVHGRWKAIVYFYNRGDEGFTFWSREKDHPTWPEHKGLDGLKALAHHPNFKGKFSGIAIYDCQQSEKGHQILYYDENGICNYKQA
jgi:hypothetical protein